MAFFSSSSRRGKEKERILRLQREAEQKREASEREELKRVEESRRIARIEEERNRIISERDQELMFFRRGMIDEEEKSKRRNEVMSKTEVNSAKHEMKEEAMGLVDRMEAHRAGTFLKNVVISNKAPADRELNLARLRTYKAPNEFSKLTMGDIEEIDLIENYVEIPITSAMDPDQYKSMRKYVHVSDVLVHYMPMTSFFSTSSPVNFFLNDYRQVEDQVVRYYPLTSSGSYNILFCLDYCVRKVDLKHLALSISTNLQGYREGVAWASVKVTLTITSMDFPIKTNMQETQGVLHMADSDLTPFISDPRGSDGVITPEAFKLMRQAYQRGDIENVLKARDDTKEVNQAKTSFMPLDQDIEVDDIKKTMRAAHKAEQERLREAQKIHSDTRKSAMKARGVSDEESKDASSKPMGWSQTTGGLDEDERKFLSEEDTIDFDDSISDMLSQGTIELPRHSSPVPGAKKSKGVKF